MPKHKNKYLERFRELNEKSGIDYTDIVDRRREEVEAVVIEKNRDFRTKNIITKAKDIKKERLSIKNKGFSALYSGFINSKNKEKYISTNRNHILKLPLGEQKRFLQSTLSFI